MLPLATLLHIGTSPGQTFGVSVFNPFIREALQLSHSQLSGTYLLASLTAAAPMPLIGWLIDRAGLRRTAFCVVVLLGLAGVTVSQANGLVTLFLGFLLLRTFGQGALTLIANNTLAMWFSRRLGLVSGVSGVGVSAAVAVIPSLYLLLINNVGWRMAYRVLGVTTWLVLLPLIALFFRNRPEDVGQQIDNGQAHDRDGDSPVPANAKGDSQSLLRSLDLPAAWRTGAYWIGLAISALWGMIGTAIFFTIVPLFQWQGLNEAQAAASFTTLAACMAGAQLIGGYLADRMPLNVLLALSVAGLLTGILTLWAMDSVWAAHAYAAQFGASQGLLIAVGNTFWPRYFGRLHLGKIRSSVWTATVAGCSVGPLIMGLSIDYLGGFGPSLGLFAGLLAVASVAALFARAPARPAADP
jgi:MFS family permease